MTVQSGRFPHPGRLSIAILENLVKPVLGEAGIKEIKAPLVAKQEQETIARALEKAEQRLTEDSEDFEVARAILDLPLATLPSVQKAVSEFYVHPTDTNFPKLLHDKLASDYSTWSAGRIDVVVERYLKILREEFVNVSPEIRSKLLTLATLAIQSDTARMAMSIEHIEAILDRIAQGKQTEADIAELRRIVVINREENIVQIGKYSVALGEGRDFHIGDRIYRGWSADAIREILQSLHPTQPSNLHLNLSFPQFASEYRKVEENELRRDDSKPSHVEWDARDTKLLRNYLKQCKKHNPQLRRLDISNDSQVRKYLITSGLAAIRDGRTYLTSAGILLCCNMEDLPRDLFYVEVKFQQRSESDELNEQFFGPVLYLYDELFKRLKPYFERQMGSPTVRDKFGAETLVYEYPKTAIVEALANLLIHRDYSRDDMAFVTVYSDRIEFMNPGQSVIAPEDLISASEPLRPIYQRNQRLIEAMNKARLNQREGGGILRIKGSLERNGTYLPNGSLGLLIKNDEIKNRFLLTIFKRVPEARSEYTIEIEGSKRQVAIGDSATVNIYNAPRPGSAPALPTLFIGREEDMKKLKARLGMSSEEKPTAPQILTAVRGWPGVGKTTLAAALAHDSDVASAFPDGVLWVSLGQNPNILSELAVWGKALGTDDLLKARTGEEASSQLRALLRNKRMLLIIDDVWETAHAIPFIVGGRSSATLITTRVSQVANALAPTPNGIYRLNELTEDDAFELLRALAPSVVAAHPDESRELINELEGLPLAIQVAGHILNVEASYGFSVSDLIRELREGAKLLVASAPADRTDLANETTPTVAVLLQRSTERLDSLVRDCFAMLGVFAPKPATFDLEAMQAVWQIEDPRPIVRTLVDRGLLEPVSGKGRFQMHALLVAHARSLLTEE
ncbi:MAG: hypothetical protein IT331_13620 [Anaerolineae bacterium]|nr:hypothetical protein [Anaerolineae bacterium]